ncbi:MAG: DUF4258 domain-containing protein [Acidobacteria bacterium]|nr:DUF4258 domain-containing protein [Acidobacteriota bacterium]
MTIHAEEEMNADGFTIFDVENGIFTGTIVERQRDIDTGEFKYVIEGESVEDRDIGVVAKLSPTRKLVIITVYEAKI